MSGTSPDDETYHLGGLAGLYALDALEGEDLERFEAHLATNAELREEVAEFRATAARLSEVSAAAPPRGLRERVLADIGSTRQDAPVVRLADRRGQLGRRRSILASVAAALVILAGAGGYFLAGSTTNERPSELASLLARSDTKVVPLTGADSDVAAGHVVVSGETGKVIIVSDKMPPAKSGRTYELWRLGSDGAVTSAGLFEPDSQGKVEASVEVSLTGATGFAITDEPDGGSPKATTPVLMTASLA